MRRRRDTRGRSIVRRTDAADEVSRRRRARTSTTTEARRHLARGHRRACRRRRDTQFHRRAAVAKQARQILLLILDRVRTPPPLIIALLLLPYVACHRIVAVPCRRRRDWRRCDAGREALRARSKVRQINVPLAHAARVRAANWVVEIARVRLGPPRPSCRHRRRKVSAVTRGRVEPQGVHTPLSRRV